MKETQKEIYEKLTNAELIEIAKNVMEEIQHRDFLRDCLTEQTYNPDEDRYDFEYSDVCFEQFMIDFSRYLHSKEHLIATNRGKTR